MECEYSLLFIGVSTAFVASLVFNIWYFRYLMKLQQRRRKETDQIHLNNIEKWKDYAVTCSKFKKGECDLSIPCDICNHYKGDNTNESKGQKTS